MKHCVTSESSCLQCILNCQIFHKTFEPFYVNILLDQNSRTVVDTKIKLLSTLGETHMACNYYYHTCNGPCTNKLHKLNIRSSQKESCKLYMQFHVHSLPPSLVLQACVSDAPLLVLKVYHGQNAR